MQSMIYSLVLFFKDTATTEIYTLSLHDALPICLPIWFIGDDYDDYIYQINEDVALARRSEEHTSELQSLAYIVCRLLLGKKRTNARVWPGRRTTTQARLRMLKADTATQTCTTVSRTRIDIR